MHFMTSTTSLCDFCSYTTALGSPSISPFFRSDVDSISILDIQISICPLQQPAFILITPLLNYRHNPSILTLHNTASPKHIYPPGSPSASDPTHTSIDADRRTFRRAATSPSNAP